MNEFHDLITHNLKIYKLVNLILYFFPTLYLIKLSQQKNVNQVLLKGTTTNENNKEKKKNKRKFNYTNTMNAPPRNKTHSLFFCQFKTYV